MTCTVTLDSLTSPLQSRIPCLVASDETCNPTPLIIINGLPSMTSTYRISRACRTSIALVFANILYKKLLLLFIIISVFVVACCSLSWLRCQASGTFVQAWDS